MIDIEPAFMTLPRAAPLGYAPMDAVHAEFDLLLARALAEREPAHLDANLAAVLEHLAGHFESEAGWMAQTAYPNAECHLDEHAAVLRSGHEVRALPDDRQRAHVAQAYFAELAAWFPAHAQHLDSALAHWIAKCQHGGKPLVFHRRAPAP